MNINEGCNRPHSLHAFHSHFNNTFLLSSPLSETHKNRIAMELDRVARGDEWDWPAYETDVTRFTSSKSLTLTAFYCTMIEGIQDGTWAQISIIKISPPTFFDNEKKEELYTARIRLQLEDEYETFVRLKDPISIKAGLKYEIRVKVEKDFDWDYDRGWMCYYCGYEGHETPITLKNGAHIHFEYKSGVIDRIIFTGEPTSGFEFAQKVFLILMVFWFMNIFIQE